MPFLFSVPTDQGQKQFSLEPGTSLYFVGANGGGKTRLAVKIEQDLGVSAHRISAHRALILNPQVPKLSQNLALRGLRYGIASEDYGVHHRSNTRWNSKAAVSLLNDFDFLVQVLFAEQSNTALVSHKGARAGTGEPAKKTQFEKLVEIWDRLLPTRKLDITGDDIQVSIPNADAKYPAAEMSDGERAIFYLIGQVLTADINSLIIFDKPELHIHRSIVSRLWDELEAARPDCGMVLISHDLEFVASRKGQTFVINDYSPAGGWVIEAVPEDTGFTEELTVLMLGSRKPILFVEGSNTSLDRAIYRACYPSWTIVPRNSCEEVIHAVATMRANANLTRITCSGIVDADGHRTEDEANFLREKGISVLSVSEIENLFMLPNVIEAILTIEGHVGIAITTKKDEILRELFESAALPHNRLSTIMRHCKRKIDQRLKKIDFSAATDVTSLNSCYIAETSNLDVSALADSINASLDEAIAQKDAVKFLKWYDNKGILSFAAKAKAEKKTDFEQWVVRSMQNNSAPAFKNAVSLNLPSVTAA